MAVLLGVLLAFIASNLLGIPAVEHEDSESNKKGHDKMKGKKAKGIAAMLFVKLCGKCADSMEKSAKKKYAKRMEKKKQRRAARLAREFGLADEDGDGEISPEVCIILENQKKKMRANIGKRRILLTSMYLVNLLNPFIPGIRTVPREEGEGGHLAHGPGHARDQEAVRRQRRRRWRGRQGKSHSR